MPFSMMCHRLLFLMLIFAPLVHADDRIVIADFSSSIGSPGVPAGLQLKEKSGKADFAVVKDGDIMLFRFNV